MQPNFVIISPLQSASFVMEDITELTLADLCRACRAQADTIIELVSEGVIDTVPAASEQPQEQWRFTGVHFHRAKVAMRLQRDLGVKSAGAALALRLMDELRVLRTHV